MKNVAIKGHTKALRISLSNFLNIKKEDRFNIHAFIEKQKYTFQTYGFSEEDLMRQERKL